MTSFGTLNPTALGTMSVVTDSSTSSDDEFAEYLDAELEVDSSSSSPNEEDDDDLDSQRNKRRKTQKLEDPEELCKKDKCKHPGSFGKMCIICGEILDIEESGVTFGYIHKNLRLGNDEIVRLRNTDTKNLLSHKKLYLVLDLDHTLLHSTQLSDLTPEEEHLKAQAQAQAQSDSSLFMLESMHMMTKLRPFVHTFLEEASKMFEMYIYTMGDRGYALEMAKLLDPKGDYFNGRVISRDESTQKDQKSLDVIPGQETAVVILDDTKNVWKKHEGNLILLKKYRFFASSCRQFGSNCKSLSQLKRDESESNGALASALKLLKRIHHMFFEELDDNLDLASRDVRQVLKTEVAIIMD